MDGNLTIHSSPNDLLRLKKTLQFIREVARSYEIGLYDHVDFSCSIAITKADELKSCVPRSCPAYPFFSELISALKSFRVQQTSGAKAIQLIDQINSYFGLDRYELVPRQSPLRNQP